MPSKRETVQPSPGSKRYLRRDERGRFTSSQVDVGSSLTSDRRQHAQTKTKAGQGDRGDRA